MISSLKPFSYRYKVHTLIVRSCRIYKSALQTRRLSTFVPATSGEKAKGAVLAAVEKLDMAHKLVHRQEETDLRGQAMADAQVSPTPLTRSGSLPWEEKFLEPSLKDVKLVDRKPRRLIVACDGTWVVSSTRISVL